MRRRASTRVWRSLSVRDAKPFSLILSSILSTSFFKSLGFEMFTRYEYSDALFVYFSDFLRGSLKESLSKNASFPDLIARAAKKPAAIPPRCPAYAISDNPPDKV